LQLVAPLRYYVSQQPRLGDRHVYGAKSRFLTPAVTACLQEVAWADGPLVDVASKVRAMW
jgi:DNA helicase II / ATP-dependent DNA helicase PcrA